MDISRLIQMIADENRNRGYELKMKHGRCIRIYIYIFVKKIILFEILFHCKRVIFHHEFFYNKTVIFYHNYFYEK